MTVKEKSIRAFAEDVQRILNGSINSELTLDIRLVEQLIIRFGENVRFEDLKRRRLESLQLNGNSDEYVKQFSSTFKNVPILFDEEQDIFYSDLPAKPLKIYEKDSGVSWVSLMKEQKRAFVPAPHFLINDDLFVMLKKRSYWIDGNSRIYYHQRDYKKDTVVMVRMLVGLADKPDTEPFIEKELEALILPQVVNYLQNRPPTDLANDGNPTI